MSISSSSGLGGEDPILARAAKAAAKAAAREILDRRDGKHADRPVAEMRRFARIFNEIAQGAGLLYQKTVKPLLKPASRLALAAGHSYAYCWDKFTHVKDKDGDPFFSKTRAAAGILLTALFAGAAGYMLDAAPDAALYAATHHQERLMLYLSNDPGTDHFTIDGSRAANTSADNAINLMVRNKPFNQLWSLTHKGRFYFANDVKAAVPSIPTWCTVDDYGLQLKLPTHEGTTYINALDVSCDTVHGSAIPAVPSPASALVPGK